MSDAGLIAVIAATAPSAAVIAGGVSDPLLVAMIAATAPTIAVFVGWLLTRRKMQQIQVNVDGRLDQALAELAEWKRAAGGLADAKLAPAEAPSSEPSS